MFDGIKFAIFDEVCKRLADSGDVHLVGEFDRDTYLPFQRAKGRYKALHVKVKSDNYAIISGSIHKFGNAANGLGELNSDQFTFERCTRAIIQLSNLLGMEPNDIKLMNLECGLNLHSSLIPVSELIERAILLGSNILKDFDDIGRQSKRTEQRLKFYDKGLQCGLGANHTLRAELACNKMRPWERIPINMVGDLLQRDVWYKSYALLENYLRDLVFAPNLEGCENLGRIRPSSLEFLKFAPLRDFWRKMASARARRDGAKRLSDLVDSLGLPNVNELLIAQARNTFSALMVEKSVVFHSRGQSEKSVVFPPLDNKGKNAPTASTGNPIADAVEVVAVELDQVPACIACKRCAAPIVGRRSDALFCGPACKRRWETNKRRSGGRFGFGSWTLFIQTD